MVYAKFLIFFCRETHPKVADIFVKKGPFLKLYTSYIREFENSTKALDDARKRYPEFETVCIDFEVNINIIILVV